MGDALGDEESVIKDDVIHNTQDTQSSEGIITIAGNADGSILAM